ncbi:hypothetical protein AWB69_09240 [Caballeronia udeis]|uniref:Uncharacterized protein n=1 Tax=Caballeronia udeis TaxID=1232866 RepID=A0A158K252_9BURK|nr:hypothetical protein AWB69_09240 [Caballeronia udeis]
METCDRAQRACLSCARAGGGRLRGAVPHDFLGSRTVTGDSLGSSSRNRHDVGTRAGRRECRSRTQIRRYTSAAADVDCREGGRVLGHVEILSTGNIQRRQSGVIERQCRSGSATRDNVQRLDACIAHSGCGARDCVCVQIQRRDSLCSQGTRFVDSNSPTRTGQGQRRQARVIDVRTAAEVVQRDASNRADLGRAAKTHVGDSHETVHDTANSSGAGSRKGARVKNVAGHSEAVACISKGRSARGRCGKRNRSSDGASSEPPRPGTTHRTTVGSNCSYGGRQICTVGLSQIQRGELCSRYQVNSARSDSHAPDNHRVIRTYRTESNGGSCRSEGTSSNARHCSHSSSLRHGHRRRRCGTVDINGAFGSNKRGTGGAGDCRSNNVLSHADCRAARRRDCARYG